ncbi:acyl-CoA carboxylase subunit beta [Gordonia zhaorongruii]|uniref:acyl-CoA carboxylase subunit beta n=1 Tax=Gordonia zhaorongruii TaxID=2597659 RepID=UPI00117F361C|nr:carboxyl transferase domain-containing protein [Gordonia zhaorongruii]
MTTLAPIPGHEEATDPRDPLLRLTTFFDEGTVALLHPRDKSGVLAATGEVNGVRTVSYCTDGTVMGGAMGVVGCAHIVNAIDTAIAEQAPVVGIWHSGGARLAEGVEALHAVGGVFEAMVRASGYVPQISVVVGFAAGGAAYGPALTDVVIMAPEGRVFVTGPDVVKSVTGESVTMEDLGGPLTHGKRSGVSHITADSEADASWRARRLVATFSQQGHFNRAHAEAGDTDLRALMPESNRRAYDVHPIVEALLDTQFAADGDTEISTFEELQAKWAPNITVGFGRLADRSVGVIANNPLRMGGCLNSEAAEKASRFVRLCDAFGIPLVVVTDVPGYLPGVGQEWNGVVRRGAKLLHSFAECSVPRVTLVTRKIYGGAYIAMNARALGATAVFAWPGSEVAVMGAKAAVGILHKKVLAAAPEGEREELHERLAVEHEQIAGGVGRAQAIGVVDDIIDPATTRSRIAEALAAAPARRGRHKNIPL